MKPDARVQHAVTVKEGSQVSFLFLFKILFAVDCSGANARDII